MVRFCYRRTFAILVALALWGVIVAVGTKASAQEAVEVERYIPSIWVDPDGCEHWVMDDGAEGYMTPHVNRQGHPICRRGTVCGIMPTDQFFATDKATINAEGQQRLRSFFATPRAQAGVIITGHTDNRASDAYNMSLSERRAASVAAIAKASGATLIDVRGYGERQPRASNDTARGKALNRRVEIICVK